MCHSMTPKSPSFKYLSPTIDPIGLKMPISCDLILTDTNKVLAYHRLNKATDFPQDLQPRKLYQTQLELS